jgi:hypothetical protein
VNAGNEIAECVLGWGNPRAVLVLFRYPFRTKPAAVPEGLTYREVNDPHWWKEEYVHDETLALRGLPFLSPCRYGSDSN